MASHDHLLLQLISSFSEDCFVVTRTFSGACFALVLSTWGLVELSKTQPRVGFSGAKISKTRLANARGGNPLTRFNKDYQCSDINALFPLVSKNDCEDNVGSSCVLCEDDSWGIDIVSVGNGAPLRDPNTTTCGGLRWIGKCDAQFRCMDLKRTTQNCGGDLAHYEPQASGPP
jgi:hypothetical protein